MRPRVLLVDDDEQIRDALKDVLPEMGIDVVGEAADGAQGVRAASELQPDVVLMDVRMPGMGGLDAARILRSEMPTTQVVLFTVYDDVTLADAGEQAGVFAYLVKGCPPAQIAQVLEQAWHWKVGVERSGVTPPGG